MKGMVISMNKLFDRKSNFTKVICLWIIVALVVSILPDYGAVTAKAEDSFWIEDGFSYAFLSNSQDVVILEYNGTAEELVIPSKTQEGYSVVAIGEYAFKNNYTLKKVTIPETITTIYECAFSMCPSLEEVTINAPISTIPFECFYNCSKLVKVELPESLGGIEKNAFAFCYALPEIELPDSIYYIDEAAFFCCLSLEKVSLSSGLKQIEVNAFAKTVITELVIPAGIQSIADMAFAGCIDLKKITFESDFIITNGFIGDNAFQGVGYEEYQDNPVKKGQPCELYAPESILNQLAVTSTFDWKEGYFKKGTEHEHSWQISLGTGNFANRITAICTTGSCSSKPTTRTLTLRREQNLIYNGKPQELCFMENEEAAWKEVGEVPEIEYYMSDNVTPTDKDNSRALKVGGAPVNAGFYIGRITYVDKDVIPNKSYEAFYAFSIEKMYPTTKEDLVPDVLRITMPVDKGYVGFPIKPTKDGGKGIPEDGVHIWYVGCDGTEYAPSREVPVDAGNYEVYVTLPKGGDNVAGVDDPVAPKQSMDPAVFIDYYTIEKELYTGPREVSVNVIAAKVNRGVAVELPKLPEGARNDSVVNLVENDPFISGWDLLDNVLYLYTNIVEVGTKSTLEINVKGAKEYRDYSVSVNVYAIDKLEATISGANAPSENLIYSGEKVATEEVFGTPVFSYEEEILDIAPAYTYYEKEGDDWKVLPDAPVERGEYKLVIAVPENNDSYRGKIEIIFQIDKSRLPELSDGEGYKIDYLEETIVALLGYELSMVSANEAATLSENKVIPGETYFVRKLGNENYSASLWKEVVVKDRPVAPFVSYAKTDKSISINMVSRNEYAIDDGQWQDSGIFENLLPNTEYLISVRVKATADSFSGMISENKIKTKTTKEQEEDDLKKAKEQGIASINQVVGADTSENVREAAAKAKEEINNAKTISEVWDIVDKYIGIIKALQKENAKYAYIPYNPAGDHVIAIGDKIPTTVFYPELKFSKYVSEILVGNRLIVKKSGKYFVAKNLGTVRITPCDKYSMPLANATTFWTMAPIVDSRVVCTVPGEKVDVMDHITENRMHLPSEISLKNQRYLSQDGRVFTSGTRNGTSVVKIKYGKKIYRLRIQVKIPKVRNHTTVIAGREKKVAIRNYESTVTLETTDSSVATVTLDGNRMVVHGHRQGTCEIIVKNKGVECGRCFVEVR